MDLGLSTIRLMSNNPKKIIGLEGYGLKITERVPLEIKPNEHNANYLKTKFFKLGHILRSSIIQSNGEDLKEDDKNGKGRRGKSRRE